MGKEFASYYISERNFARKDSKFGAGELSSTYFEAGGGRRGVKVERREAGQRARSSSLLSAIPQRSLCWLLRGTRFGKTPEEEDGWRREGKLRWCHASLLPKTPHDRYCNRWVRLG